MSADRLHRFPPSMGADGSGDNGVSSRSDASRPTPPVSQSNNRPWTPGPWEWWRADTGYRNLQRVPKDGGNLGQHVMTVRPWAAASQGDADLIALAPDMAAAILAWDDNAQYAAGDVEIMGASTRALYAAAEKLRSIGNE